MLLGAILPIGLGIILASFLMPLPGAVVDILLVFSLLLSLVLFASALYVSEPVKISALPGILLLATLFRLSLNVSTTRLILTTGDAGEAIHAFAHIVTQGSLVVGIVIFLIITLIQFIVIAKGAERVAEVSARFTLDALPGKQMSIDADVRAGLIDFETARTKRQELQTESRFYGALDGAMKFVKGDAIAGLLIIIINVIGGFVTGVAVGGMDALAAAQKYTFLTIGDGLISQIPALLCALSAGIVVTRVTRGDGQSLPNEIISQLGQFTGVKCVIGVSSLFLALVPGMPTLPFVGFGIVFLALGIWGIKKPQHAAVLAADAEFAPRSKPVVLIAMYLPATMDPQRASLVHLLMNMRTRVFEKFGILLGRPEFSFKHAEGQSAEIFIRGGTGIKIDLSGKTISQMSEHLCEEVVCLAEKRAVELIDDAMTRRMLDYVEAEFNELVSTLIPQSLSLTQTTELLRALLHEGIPVRNLDLILQSVAGHVARGGDCKNSRILLEEVRCALKRVVSVAAAPQGTLEVVYLDPLLDISLARAERTSDLPSVEEIDLLVTTLRHHLSIQSSTHPAAVVVSRGARAFLRDCLAAQGVSVMILAHEELTEEVQKIALGTVTVSHSTRESIVDRLAA